MPRFIGAVKAFHLNSRDLLADLRRLSVTAIFSVTAKLLEDRGCNRDNDGDRDRNSNRDRLKVFHTKVVARAIRSKSSATAAVIAQMVKYSLQKLARFARKYDTHTPLKRHLCRSDVFRDSETLRG